MRRDLSLPIFLIALACSLGFIWWSSSLMPERVASHFGASGRANGFSTREVYTALMLGICAIVPVFTVLLPRMMLRMPGARINLPNRDYWLAPERREETITTICRHITGFGLMLLAFLTYVHWLVVQANASPNPTLPGELFFPALILFIGAMLIWTIVMLSQFRRPPN